MPEKGFFSLSKFAELSRATRDTLHYYDKIDLLSPVSRGENNYRYYSSGQLAVMNVIRTMQVLGMTLEEIKNLIDHRTPERTVELLEQKVELLDAKIDDWVRARKLLFVLKKVIEATRGIAEDTITVQFVAAEAIILGDINDYSRGRNDYDALLSFYQAMQEKYPDLDMNYPVWGMFSEERIKRGDWVWPDRYYFYNPEGHDRRPAGLYATGYTRGGYGQSDELYRRLLDYIGKHSFEICGNIYEEYPLNEVSVSDDTSYLIRVMIPVLERRK